MNLAEALSIEAGELSCPVRSANHIHIANEIMRANRGAVNGEVFLTSNGVKKLPVEDHRAVPQSFHRRT